MIINEDNSNTSSIEWEKPIPFTAQTDTLPDFPVNALPETLRDMVLAIAETTSTDVGMAGTAMLASVSYCFTGVYRLSGKPDHVESPAIYALMIADPSERKSPVMRFIRLPFDISTDKYNREHRREILRNQQTKKALLKAIAHLEDEPEQDIEQIVSLREELEQIKGDKPLRVAVDDMTPAAMIQLMRDFGSLLLISDEPGMLANFSGKYGGEPNLDMLLKAWGGEQYICDRATKEPVIVKRPYLSVALAGQPSVWGKLAGNDALRSRGLLARFVMCFAKNSNGVRKYDTESIPDHVSRAYHDLIDKLLTFKFEHTGKETTLRLSEDAYAVYVDYYNQCIAPALAAELLFLQDWAGKMHGLVLRIALVLHGVDCCIKGVDPAEETVNAETVRKAIWLTEYYKEQAKYGFMRDSPGGELAKAEKAIKIIKAKGITKSTKSDLCRACRCTSFPTSKVFYDTLEMLEENGYVAIRTELGSNHKPVDMVYINPLI